METLTEHFHSVELSAAAHGRTQPRWPINGRYCEFFLTLRFLPTVFLCCVFLFFQMYFFQSSEFKYNKAVYLEKAQRWTVKYATQKNQVSICFLTLLGLYNYIRKGNANMAQCLPFFVVKNIVIHFKLCDFKWHHLIFLFLTAKALPEIPQVPFRESERDCLHAP